MFNYPAKVSSPLVQAIEDAVLFGNVQEIDGILELVREDINFPDNLRYALESLMYFRMHYGKGGIMEPTEQSERQMTAQLETWWGREVIQMIGHYPDLTEAKYA